MTKKRKTDPGKSQDQKRVRRSPELARAHILAAAKRVFAERGPDAAGLKEVAAEAGVSHGLVTHYFGTYEGLVEAALEETAEQGRLAILERLAEAGGSPNSSGDVRAMIEMFVDIIEQPLHGRLLAWAMLSGRMADASFFARRVQGPKIVADAIEARLRLQYPEAAIDRDEIDRLIVLVMTVGFGHSVARGVLSDALGRPNDATERAAFRCWLSNLIRDRLEVAMGIDKLAEVVD
jgi:TetR/AcrR family transcriptional regulator, repressor for neighboring sulfatase